MRKPHMMPETQPLHHGGGQTQTIQITWIEVSPSGSAIRSRACGAPPSLTRGKARYERRGSGGRQPRRWGKRSCSTRRIPKQSNPMIRVCCSVILRQGPRTKRRRTWQEHASVRTLSAFLELTTLVSCNKQTKSLKRVRLAMDGTRCRVKSPNLRLLLRCTEPDASLGQLGG